MYADVIRTSEARLSKLGWPGTVSEVNRGAVGPASKAVSVSDVRSSALVWAKAEKPLAMHSELMRTA